MGIVSMEAINKLKKSLPAEAPKNISDNRLDVPGYLTHYGITISKTKVEADRTIYALEKCVFDPTHGKGQASIIQGDDGKLIYKCFHNSCNGRTWKEAREIISGKDSLKSFMPETEVKTEPLLPSLSEGDILSKLETWEQIREMDIKVEWLIDRLLPKESITVLFGKGGIGKTWLSLDMARAVGTGEPFLGLATKQSPVVFIDFENPLAVLNTRTQKLGNGENVYFWRANNQNIPAPKLDSANYHIYKQLPKDALLIIDTLRASQSKDENSSQDMALVMNRLKELRDMGHTIILLHHTAKNSDKISKGSTAIVDLADHILGMTLVHKKQDGKDVIVDDDDDSDEERVYRFGVREKTRFEPYQIYLTLNPDRGFELAPDPQEDNLKKMSECLNAGDLKKTSFLKICKEKTDLSEKRLRSLFNIGQGRYWKAEKTGADNAIMVSQIRFGGLALPIGDEKPQNQNSVWRASEKTEIKKSDEPLDNNGFGGFAGAFGKPKKPAIIEVEEILS
jgi:archaellum biogenesis ATPase FlaH